MKTAQKTTLNHCTVCITIYIFIMLTTAVGIMALKIRLTTNHQTQLQHSTIKVIPSAHCVPTIGTDNSSSLARPLTATQQHVLRHFRNAHRARSQWFLRPSTGPETLRRKAGK
ncbi:hypothetical protein BDV19DRAFT_63513 [Aspergillus venezuelensis]